jgi:trans-2,3-dihydro-3-hydroxyanthranilate isomerase
MTREYRFVQVDVFTERVLAGNALAVVLDGRGLSDAEMQAIAKEMNVSETTFLLPPTLSDCVARVRIFTPARELPFAGHPTLGTAWVLAAEGRLPTGATTIALEEGIGPVMVELEGEPSRPRFVWMRHRDATFGAEQKERGALARALGLGEDDLLPSAPIESGSTGNSFVYVPLRDRDAVDRAAVDARALEACLRDDPLIGVFVFAPDPDPRAARLYSRMFAPAHGVPEDPATGSASGALGAYVVRHGLVRADGNVRIVSEQGTKMGRQSFVHIALHASAAAITDIKVGGSVVPALDGRLTLP